MFLIILPIYVCACKHFYKKLWLQYGPQHHSITAPAPCFSFVYVTTIETRQLQLTAILHNIKNWDATVNPLCMYMNGKW